MSHYVAYRTVAIFAFAAVIGCTLAACAPQPSMWDLKPITHPETNSP